MSKPKKLNFEVYQGATWEHRLLLTNAGTNTPFDLTGFQARMQVREEVGSPESILDLSAGNGRLVVSAPLSGELLILVPASIMADLPLDGERKVYVHDIEVFRPLPAPEYVRRVFEGKVKCFPETTRL
ncbi:MAG: hypothetical protein ACRC2H_13455 [Silanimonas sp.]